MIIRCMAGLVPPCAIIIAIFDPVPSASAAPRPQNTNTLYKLGLAGKSIRLFDMNAEASGNKATISAVERRAQRIKAAEEARAARVRERAEARSKIVAERAAAAAQLRLDRAKARADAINAKRERDKAAEIDAAETLSNMAKNLTADTSVIRGLEALLSRSLGLKVTHLRGEHVLPPRSTLMVYVKAQKTHTLQTFRISGRGADAAADQEITVFVKASTKAVSTPFDSLLNGKETSSFRAPHFFGLFKASGLNVGAWEFVQGTRSAFDTLPHEVQVALARAVAGISAIQVPGATVPIKTKWVAAPLAWYEKSFQSMTQEDQDKWRDAFSCVSAILERHDAVLGYLNDLGEPLLAHNDINPNNVFILNDAKIVVFDWEAAMLSVPGADLRFLHRLPAKDELLDHYIDELKNLGISLRKDNVRNAYEIVEGFRLVNKGWAKRNLSAVRTGLALLSEHQGIFPQPRAAQDEKPGDSENGEMQAGPPPALTPPPPTEESRIVKTPSAELIDKVNEYVANRGAIYAPIAHPAFSSTPARWTPERFEKIKQHIDPGPGTALDIGSHWGYIAHQLEDMGYDVTAVEHSRKHIYFLKEIRDLCEKNFKIEFGSVFSLKDLDYDLVIALNIFHHFLKTDEVFAQFNDFLSRLKCRTMIYQAHRPTERPKLDMANHYMEPAEMARFLADKLGLSKVTPIGSEGGRDIFKLTQ